MRKVIICSFKGGTGKTTTAVNLSVALARAGRQVLLLDFDPQANATMSLNQEPQVGLYEMFTLGTDVRRVVVKVEPGLDLVPASRQMMTITTYLDTRPRPSDILCRRLSNLTGYDFVILDTPPSYTRLTQNALLYASEAWVPVSMEFFALAGAKDVIDALEELSRDTDHVLPIQYVIPTFHDARNNKTQEVMSSLRKGFGKLVTRAVRSSVRLSEAPSFGQSIFDYAPGSAGAEDYQAIARRITKDG